MTTSLVIYGLIVGLITAAGARALEGVARIAGRPVRWVWAGALVLTFALVALAPFRPLAISPPSDTPHSVPAQQPVQIASPGTVEAAQSSANPTMVLRRIGGAMAVILPATISAVSRRVPASVESFVSILWLGLSALMLALFAFVLIRFRLLQRRWPVVELHGVSVRLAPDGGPLVVGLARSEIVVPRWLLSLAPESQRLVLAHEGEHVRARDPLLLGIGCAITALLPWHPAAWWMLARLRLGVELDCDARVLCRGAAPRTYGELLVDLAGRHTGLPAGVPALAAKASHLQERLLAMMPDRFQFPRARGGALSVLAGLALFAACAARVPGPGSSPARGSQTPRDTVVVVLVPIDSAPTRMPAPVIARTDSQPLSPLVDSSAANAARTPEPLRGIDSLLVAMPLVLLDGVPVQRTQSDTGFTYQTRSAPIVSGRVDVNSIENVEVFKGPMAVAIYGPDAVNGVSVITTKKRQGATPANPQSGAAVPAPPSQVRNGPLFVVDGAIVSDSDAPLATTPGYFFTSKSPAVTWSLPSRPDIEQSGLANRVELGDGVQGQPLVNVTFEGALLSDVVKVFVEFSGRSIVIAPGAGNPRVTASIRNMEWQRALDRILEPLALVARADSAGVIRIEAQAPPSVTPRD